MGIGPSINRQEPKKQQPNKRGQAKPTKGQAWPKPKHQSTNPNTKTAAAPPIKPPATTQMPPTTKASTSHKRCRKSNEAHAVVHPPHSGNPKTTKDQERSPKEDSPGRRNQDTICRRRATAESRQAPRPMNPQTLGTKRNHAVRQNRDHSRVDRWGASQPSEPKNRNQPRR